MKGFIHLVEVVVASILIVIVLGSFFTIQNVKLDFERPDLVSVGNYMLNGIRNSGKFYQMLSDPTVLDEWKEKNVKYGLEIKGIPKPDILIGCEGDCLFAFDILKPSYMNGRWISFTVEDFDLSQNEMIPDDYDAFIFVDYTGYSAERDKIENYLERGGVVVGLNDTKSSSDSDFNDIFDLSSSSGPSSSLRFSFYDPSKDETAKYFLGSGFDISTPYTSYGKKYGWWYILGSKKMVNITESGIVEIESMGTHNEGDTFQNPIDSGTYKVKKIFWPNSIIIQPMNETFAFNDFSENNIAGRNIVSNTGDSTAGLTISGNSVWMSSFGDGDEYRALLKSAIMSRVNDWELAKTFTGRNIKVSSFEPTCCDTPDIAEVVLTLWYVF